MKTKNNVQKTILRGLAVVISFVLISFTVSAQEFWKKLLTNSSFNEIALAMTERAGKTENQGNAGITTADFYLETITDPELSLEDWMTNSNSFEAPEPVLNNASESRLIQEDWMFNKEYFGEKNSVEEPLELEDWMISSTNWEI